MDFSIFAPYRGITGYDQMVRTFIKEWYYQGHNMHLTEFKNWSNLAMSTPLDEIFLQLEQNTNINPEFHLNFCLLHQCVINPHTMNVCYTMFESDKICESWVMASRKLDLIIVPTEWNKSIFVKSGIPENKVAVCAIPVDLTNLVAKMPRGLDTYTDDNIIGFKHRFLHVSEYIDRKNVNGLLKAWVEETKPEDDACLILKLCSNSGVKLDFFKSKVDDIVKNKKCAPVFFYNNIMSQNDMLNLYHSCTHYITATCGEGWGLSETISGLLGKLVVAPKSSAFLDYLTDDNSYRVDTQAVRARQSGPTKVLYDGSNWFVPIQFRLRKQLRKAIEDANNGDYSKGTKLSTDLKALCDSFPVSQKLLKTVREYIPQKSKIDKFELSETSNNFNFMMICKSLGAKCGIADYTQMLYRGIETEQNKKLYAGGMLVRGESVDYPDIIDNYPVNLINIQLEYQFISPKRLKMLISYLWHSNIVPVVTMHTVNPRAFDYHEVLRDTGCPIIVSSQVMKDSLIMDCGFSRQHNIKVIPMGISTENVMTSSFENRERFKIGFFGFCYFHKGIDKIMQYMKVHGQDKDCLILSCKPENDSGYFDRARKLLNGSTNVKWVIDYLDDAEVINQLSNCDLIFLPYKEYGGLAVSAAIRTCLKAGVPIVSFDTSFFNDPVHDLGIVKFVGSDPDNFDDWSTHLNTFIESLKTMGIAHAKEQYLISRDKFINEYNWENTGKRYLEHFQELLKENKGR